MAALYRGGVFLIGQGCDDNGNSPLLVAARDSSLPPLGTATGANVGGEGLREIVSPLNLSIPGEYSAGACFC